MEVRHKLLEDFLTKKKLIPLNLDTRKNKVILALYIATSEKENSSR